jgi:hypothetical protein
MHKVKVARAFFFAEKRKEHSGRLTRVEIPGTAPHIGLLREIAIKRGRDLGDALRFRSFPLAIFLELSL